jgi:ubiquitin-protein ligase
MASEQSSRKNTIIKKYYKAYVEGKKSGFEIRASDDTYEHFYILYKPKNWIYSDQIHILEMKTMYGSNEIYCYPKNPPKLQFLTKIYHTNISKEGSICVDILKDINKWQPTTEIHAIMSSIELLLEIPNADSPFDSTACNDYVSCETDYNRAVDTISSSGKTLTVSELEQLKQQHFLEYKKKANAYAKFSASSRKKYEEYFLSLTDSKYDIDQDPHYIMLTAMYNKLVPKAENVIPDAADIKENEVFVPEQNSAASNPTDDTAMKLLEKLKKKAEKLKKGQTK